MIQETMEEGIEGTDLNWVKGSKYYNLHIQPNLFGGTSVIKSWGSTVSGRGGHKILFCESELEIAEVIKQVLQRRKARKYEKVKKEICFSTEELLKLESSTGNSQRLRDLIKPNADINICDSDGRTPLRRASYSKDHEIVSLLIDLGADPDIQCNKGCTALMEACWKGHVDIVKLLIGAGADVNLKTDKSETALSIATTYNHTQIIEILLKAGAKPEPMRALSL